MSALSALVTAAGESLLALVSPPQCAACDARLAQRAVFCVPCARTIERAPREREHDALFVWGGALAKAITRFKYEDATHLAHPLGEMLRRAGPFLPAPTLVIPVPLHPRRLADRGFNQAALLARPIARDLGVPLELRALVRMRDTSRQASLERTARLTNVAGAFAARRRLDGHHVLLVDDVCTTGATLRACAAALEGAGAKVRNLVLAIAL